MPNYERINPSQLASQFTQLDRQNRERALNERENQVQGELRAMRSLRTEMQDLLNVFDDFSGDDGGLITPQASSANENIFTATSAASAQPGSYAIRVKQLASEHQVSVNLTGVTLPTDGELVISMASENIAVDFSTLPASASLQDVASAINDLATNSSIDASVINAGAQQHLVITSRETGEATRFTLAFNSASDPAGGVLSASLASANTMSVGQDSRILIGEDHNTAIEVISSSNTVENVIEGVTLNLNARTRTGPVNLTVERNTEDAQTNLQSFVDGYNEIIESISNEDGPLYRDSTARQIVGQMRRIMSSQYEGQSLYSIGVEFNRDGRLTIDSGRLENALENSADNVNAMLSGDAGVFNALDDYVSTYTGSTGLLADRTNSLQERLDLVTTQQQRFSALMDLRYERYLSEFNALRSTMAQMETSMSQFG